MNKEILRQYCRENTTHLIMDYLSNPLKAIDVDIDDLLVIATQYGQIKLAKFLLTDQKLPVKANIGYQQGYALITACYYGQLETIKFLLHSKEIPVNADINAEDGKAFTGACSEGQLEVVKYILSLSNFNNAIHLCNQGLGYAAQNSNLSVVKYLLEESVYKDQIDIHYMNDVCLNWACTKGNIALITYLTTSPTLKEHIASINSYNKAVTIGINKRDFKVLDYFLNNDNLKVQADFHYEEDKNFTTVLKNNYFPMLDYLILEQKITRTDNIKKMIEQNIVEENLCKLVPNIQEMSIYANKLFDMVQLNEKLHTTIENKDSINNKKNKI